jgi:hypothetical protein
MSKRVFSRGRGRASPACAGQLVIRGLGHEIQTSQILIQAKVFFYTAEMSCDTHTKPKERYIHRDAQGRALI